MAKIRFWRLQEVEVPFMDGIDIEDAIKAIDENNSLFDTDDLDWDSEEVVGEDYSGATQSYGLYLGEQLVNNYHPGSCETWIYCDRGIRDWSKRLVAYLDAVIASNQNC